MWEKKKKHFTEHKLHKKSCKKKSVNDGLEVKAKKEKENKIWPERVKTGIRNNETLLV